MRLAHPPELRLNAPIPDPMRAIATASDRAIWTPRRVPEPYHKFFPRARCSRRALTPQDTGTPATGVAAATAFLDRLRPETRGTFLAMRALVISLGPDVEERAGSGELVFLRRGKIFATVRAARSSLSLIFPPGITLEDPMGRLMRRGEERVVPLDAPEGIDGHVQEFVRKAYTAQR